MKINWKVRAKNPYFWVGLAGAIFAASGISTSDITSWSSIAGVLLDFIKNPVAVISVLAAIIGIVLDPTTSGVSDSDRAMTYTSPSNSSYIEE